MKNIKNNRLVQKNKSEKGSTILLMLVVFVPICVLMLCIVFVISNYFTVLKQIKGNTVEVLIAQNGIERYINELKNDQSFEGKISFNNTSNGEDYDISVTSERISDDEEKVKIISKVMPNDYTCEKIIKLSRIID